MTFSLWILLALVAVLLIGWRLMIPSLSRPLAEARAQKDVSPVIAAVERLRPSSRPAAYNHAIRQLWDAYDRVLALDLVKVLAERHSDSLIAQYWLKQVLQVEPELATRVLSKEFLTAHYRPELAAQCGPVG